VYRWEASPRKPLCVYPANENATEPRQSRSKAARASLRPNYASVRDPPQLSWQRTISGVLNAGPQTITEPVVTSIHALHVARVQPHNRTGACEMSVRRCVRDGCPDGCEGSHTSLDIENQATTNRSLATARCALIVSSHSVRTSHPRDRITSM